MTIIKKPTGPSQCNHETEEKKENAELEFVPVSSQN